MKPHPPRSQRASYTSPRLQTTKDLRRITEKLDESITNFEDMTPFVTAFFQTRTRKVTLQKEKKAKEVQDMMNKFSSNVTQTLFRTRCDNDLDTYNTKLNDTADAESDFIEEANVNRMKFEYKTDKRWEKMQQRHAQELEEHDRKRPYEAPAKFRRRSPQLLNLCTQERRLIFQSRFKEADKIREQIDQIENEESRYQMDMAWKHWNTKLHNIKMRHEREEKVMQQWIETRRIEYDQDKNSQVEAMEKRQFKIRSQIADVSKIRNSTNPRRIRRAITFNSTYPIPQIDNAARTEKVDRIFERLPETSHKVLRSLRP